MVLTEQEIKRIGEGNTGSWQDDLQFARAIESAVLEKLKAQEPYEIEYPEYHQHGMGCGLEDRNITDRYKAMAYGWDRAIGAMAERIPDRLYEHPLPPADVVRDAERYRWLRDVGCYEFKPFVQSWMKTANECDAAIDAAMEKMK